MKTSFFLKLIAFAILSAARPTFAQILHLEIGAANYSGANHEKRFLVLEQTLQELILKFGPIGTVYLNDIDPVGLPEAVDFSKGWLKKNGYNSVEVISLYGDMRTLKVPVIMKSMNLTNPGRNQFPAVIQGLDFALDMAQALGNLAARSESGLRISTYFYPEKHEFLPLIEMMLEGSFHLRESAEHGLPYFANSGERIEPESPTRVFYLQKNRPQTVTYKCSQIFQKPKYVDFFEVRRRRYGGFTFW